jgi:hypothetical protein
MRSRSRGYSYRIVTMTLRTILPAVAILEALLGLAD